MKFAIISINNLRAENKTRTRDILLPEFEEIIGIEYAHAGNLEAAIEKYGQYAAWDNPKVGEIGVWYSNIAVWHYMVDNEIDELLVLEDDAILVDDFQYQFAEARHWLPSGWDYLSLWIPPNQDKDYYYNITRWSDGWAKEIRGNRRNDQSHFYVGNDFVAKMYQGYGCIAMLYSLKGARAALEMIGQTGISSTYDCYMASVARQENGFEGYAIHPLMKPMVSHDFKRPSTIQQTERYYATGS